MHFSTISSLALVAGTTLAAPSAPVQPRGDSDIESAIPPIVPVNTRANDLDFISKLLLAPTQGDRTKLFDQPGDFVFDFNVDKAPEGTVARGNGGASVAATAKSFPALVGNGASMTLAFLGPCGMNTPHVHPRATELNVVVEGHLVTNHIQENGADLVANTMTKYQMSVFPQGAIHMEFNPLCTPAVFVAAFPHEDPGVSQVAQNFFGLAPNVVDATLGGVPTIKGEDIESFREMIPANIAQGIDACLNTCGIQRKPKRSVREILEEAS